MTGKFQVRAQPDQIALFDEAARHAGLDRSSWIRDRLLRIAREELKKA